MLKELKIEIPEGYEIDQKNSTFEKIVFQKRDDYPKSVKEVTSDRFYFICSNSEIKSVGGKEYCKDDKDLILLSSRSRAEAFLALMQLVELCDAWNRVDGSIISWGVGGCKYTIHVRDDGIKKDKFAWDRQILAFGKEGTRDKFIETFKDLILTAKEFLV